MTESTEDRTRLLPQLLEERARGADRDRPYLQTVEGRSLSYGDVHAQSGDYANQLRALGIALGDRVVSIFPPMPEAVLTWVALSWCGAIDVPLNPDLPASMVEPILESVTPKALITTRELWKQLSLSGSALGGVHPLIVSADGKLDHPEHGAVNVESSDSTFEHHQPEVWELTTIMTTSGTTGQPKGVMMPWGHLLETASHVMPLEELGLGRDDAYYCPFGLFHISGRAATFCMALLGGRVVFRDRFRTEDFWDDIREHRCSMTLLMATMAQFLLETPPDPKDRDNPLEKVVIAPLPPDVSGFEDRFAVDVLTVYNMSELSVPLASPASGLANGTSCGRVRVGFECRVVDEHDRALPPGQVGELVVRHESPWKIMDGYWQNPEATAAAWRNQWFHTGDAFSFDDEGNFYFRHRVKDVIRRRGENISAAQLEAIACEHPAVFGAAAVGVPSPYGEEDVKIVLMLREGQGKLDVVEFLAFLESRCPRFMVPRYVEVVDAFPLTPSGRVRKFLLKDAGITANTWDREAR